MKSLLKYKGSIFYLCYCFIRTKLLFKNARLIRFPIDIRGKDCISVGHGFTTGRGCRIEAEYILDTAKPQIKIGNNVQINDYVHITAAQQVLIEDNVLIASKVYISDCSHGSYGKNNIHDSPLTAPKDREIYNNPVIIKKNVWIGDNVCILPGVTIGEGAIIGANAVVNKNIPPYCIAVGIPAKIVKKYNFQIEKWEIAT
jgi:acetyltransferase-like isoleucine patch superfamily enzyme